MRFDSAEAEALHAALGDANLWFPKRPRFVADLDLFDLPDGLGIYLKGLTAPVCLRGSRARAAVDYLRAAFAQKRTLGELVAGCPEAVGQAAMLKALTILHRKGAIRGQEATARAAKRSAGAVAARERQFFDRTLDATRYNALPEAVETALASSGVALVAGGLIGAATLDLLVRSGIGRVTLATVGDAGPFAGAAKRFKGPLGRQTALPADLAEGRETTALAADIGTADLVVAATPAMPEAFFGWLNDLCLAARTDLLRGEAREEGFEMGPHVQPFRGPCHTCLTLRRRSAAPYAVEEQLWQDAKAEGGAARPTVPEGEYLAGASFAAAQVVAEALRILTFHEMPVTTGTVHRNAAGNFAASLHPVLRVPGCPACGGAAPEGGG